MDTNVTTHTENNALSASYAKETDVTKLEEFQRGRSYYMRGEFAEGLTIFEQLHRDHRNDPYVNAYIGMIAAEAKDFAKAKSYLLVASKLSDDPMLLVNLGMCLNMEQDYDASIKCFNKALKIDSECIPAFVQLCAALFLRGDYDTLKRMSEYGFKRFGELPAVTDKIINMHLVNGDTEIGTRMAEEEINKRPENPELLRLRTEFGKIEIDHPAVGHAERYIEQAMESTLPNDRGMNAGFSLFRHYEQHKQYDKAFDYLEKANAIKRRELDYSMDRMRHRFDLIKNNYTEDVIRQEDIDEAEEKYPARPIFILGMPRSGTSLTEQIIASHPDTYGAGELREMGHVFRRLYAGNPTNTDMDAFQMRDLTPHEIVRLGGTYMRILREKSGRDDFKYSTDKMPHNFLNIAAIRRVFPHAKIIHTSRNPVDNCLSIYSKNFAGHHDYSFDQTILGEYYCEYVALMEHFSNVLGDAIYQLNYEALVSDFEPQVRKLLDFCEIPFHKNCLTPHKTKRATRTASAGQVVKPIYQTSVEKWRRYEKHLGPLLEALAPVYTPPALDEQVSA